MTFFDLIYNYDNLFWEITKYFIILLSENTYQIALKFKLFTQNICYVL